jgi:hypothetical protein
MSGSAVHESAGERAQRGGTRDGIRVRRQGRCIVVSVAALADAARRFGLLEPGGLSRWLASGVPGPAGRAGTARIELAGSGALHVRPVVHGGLLGRSWRGRVLGLGRATRELRVAMRLAAAGAPVARPALVAGERRLGLWRVAIAHGYEAGALDAASLLSSAPSRARVDRAAAAAGRALRRFHDLGGRHADLHAGNLLLREGPTGCEAVLVDLDRARHGSPPGASARFAEMMRLYRSLLKRDLARRVGARGCAAFLGAYTGSDRELRRALLRRLPRERHRLELHRLGWKLAGSMPFASPGAATRALRARAE